MHGCRFQNLIRMVNRVDDLISRQAAIDALGERPMVWTSDDDYSLGERNQYDADRFAVETVPSVDAVEVVRCKDCVNCEYDSIFNQYWCGGSEVISDGFCNYGERKDG